MTSSQESRNFKTIFNNLLPNKRGLSIIEEANENNPNNENNSKKATYVPLSNIRNSKLYLPINNLNQEFNQEFTNPFNTPHSTVNFKNPDVKYEEKFGFDNENKNEYFGFDKEEDNEEDKELNSRSNNLSEDLNFNTDSLESTGNFNKLIDKHSSITISSDCEGINPTSQIKKIMDAKKLIYLGDFLDYTTNYNNNKVDPSHVANDNLCSLKLLQHFNDNPDVKCVLGNREFNKVKFWPLVQIFDDNDKLVIWWKDANNNILDIAMKLCTILKPSSDSSNKWVYNDLQSFCPFWRYKHDIDPEFKGKFEKHWGINPKNNGTVIATSLKKRYYYLFGNDFPSGEPQGTISAVNTINCLPRELGYSDEDLKTFMNGKKMTTNEDDIEEFKAAIVFTVYARMLDISLYKKTPDKNHGINYSKDKSNALHLDGVLANYLSTTPCVGYINDDTVKDFYLFAHGGISLDFVQNDITEKFYKIAEAFKIKKYNLCKHIQSGGNKSTSNFIKKINDFNKKVSTLMKKTLSEGTSLYSDYLDVLNILMSLCVPNSVQLADTGYKSSMSPIVTGLPIYDDLEKTLKLTKGVKLYTFFGHIPNGCGYGFYKVGKQQYSITTDFSSSLFTSNIVFDNSNKSDNTYNNNNLLLKLNTSRSSLQLEGEIQIKNNNEFKQLDNINSESYLKLLNTKQYKDAIKISGFRLYYPNRDIKITSLKIKFNIEDKNIQQQLKEFKIKMKNDNPNVEENSNIVFHGMATVTVNESSEIFKATLFSVTNGFHKELVIMTHPKDEKTSKLPLRTIQRIFRSRGGSRKNTRKRRHHKRIRTRTRINIRRNIRKNTKRNSSRA
jgi:hypothetical protein